MMIPELLTIKNLSFRWNENSNPLFHDINLDFKPGLIYSLVGINGSGKTTFLEVISGRLNLDKGEIFLGNKKASPNDFNYLPQKFDRLVFDHLTLEENIFLNENGLYKKDKIILDTLFPQKKNLKKYPKHLSGGQRQRMTVCRAIFDIAKFPVTILDESFSQLSREIKINIKKEIYEATKKYNAIVIIVTHDIFDAMIFADQVLTLSNGDISIHDTNTIKSVEDCYENTKLFNKIIKCVTTN